MFSLQDAALGHVVGYTVAHDVSARDWQLKRCSSTCNECLEYFLADPAITIVFFKNTVVIRD